MSGIAIVPTYGPPNSNELRLRNQLHVTNHLQAIFDNVFSQHSYQGISELHPASPGAARNYGAAHTTEDMLVFNDADTICPPAQIREAVRLAGERPGLVFAYDLYVRVGERGSRAYLAGGGPIEGCGSDQEIFNSGSMGCVAISRACFEQVGGFDESYQGWGYEDLDFAQRCGALWPNRRVSGPVYHLWHGDRRADDSPLDSDAAQVQANMERFRFRSAMPV